MNNFKKFQVSQQLREIRNHSKSIYQENTFKQRISSMNDEISRLRKELSTLASKLEEEKEYSEQLKFELKELQETT
jgi:nucleotidyltransferase/DNA polymerase involved in DNA repair